jgi:hypothetical protein
VIVNTLHVEAAELERRTGWVMKPEGACKGDVCVPLPPGTVADGRVDVTRLAEKLRMPVLHDEAHALWALGPESGGHALTTAAAPDLVLPDRQGQTIALSSLRGQKVLLVAWASW